MKTKRIRALVATLLLPIALMVSAVAAAQVAPLNCPTALVNGGCTTPTNRPSYEARVEHLTWNAGQWANALNACQGRSTGHFGGVSCANVQAMSTLCRSGNAGSSALVWCDGVGLVTERERTKFAIVDRLNVAASVLDATDKALAAALRKSGPKTALEHFDSLAAGATSGGCGSIWDAFKTEAKANNRLQSRTSSALQAAPLVTEALAGIKTIRDLDRMEQCKVDTVARIVTPSIATEEQRALCAGAPTDDTAQKATIAAVNSMINYVGNKHVCR